MWFVTIRLRSFALVLALALALLPACLFARGTDAAAVWSRAASRSLPVYSVERQDNKIAISFDCAWGADYTREILSHLEAAGVRATFFVVQFWAETYPEVLKEIAAAGHEVGTHSATHSYMSRLSEAEIRSELTSSSDAIEKAAGVRPELFRPPYGDYDDLLIETSLSMGLLPVQWDVDSLDWKDLSAQEIVSRILAHTRSGSIILCHNNGLHTAKALPAVIDSLRAKGFTFVPVGELVYRDNYAIDPAGRQYLRTE